MSLIKSCLCLALATAAAARNFAPTDLPINGQDGALHFPLICKVTGAGNQVFDGVYQATAPAVGGLAQEIYYTEAAARVVVPPNNVFKLAPKLGVTQASARIFVDILTTNASPAAIPLFAHGLLKQNISIPVNHSITVDIPGRGKVIPPIGPVTLGSVHGNSVIRLGAIHINLDLQDVHGKTVIKDYKIDCPIPLQKPEIILGVVNVQKPAGLKPLTISSGGRGNFSAVPENYQIGSFRFPYSCTFGRLGSQNVDLSVSGTVPTFVTAGRVFSISNATAFLRVPKAVVSRLKKSAPMVVSARTTFETFFIKNKHVSPAEINALTEPITSTSPVGVGELSIPIPENGVLNVGPLSLVPSAETKTAFLGLGSATAALAFLDRSKKVISRLDVQCRPSYPINFVGLPIVSTNS